MTVIHRMGKEEDRGMGLDTRLEDRSHTLCKTWEKVRFYSSVIPLILCLIFIATEHISVTIHVLKNLQHDFVTEIRAKLCKKSID